MRVTLTGDTGEFSDAMLRKRPGDFKTKIITCSKLLRRKNTLPLPEL